MCKTSKSKSLGCTTLSKAASKRYIKLYSLALESDDPCPGMSYNPHIEMRPAFLCDDHKFHLPKKCLRKGLYKTLEDSYLKSIR